MYSQSNGQIIADETAKKQFKNYWFRLLTIEEAITHGK